MKKEFTFVVITYNQEHLIHLHLNSIKKLIQKYGEGIECNLIISDDCSSDNTIGKAQEWISNNKDLFYEISILTSEKNLGIVGNYCKCLQAIKTDWFKLLAGDDVYYDNNVFRIIQDKYDLIVTPTVGFDNNDVRLVNREVFWLTSSKKSSKKRKQILQKRLRMHNSPCAPSMFFRKSLVTSEMINYVSQYKWIEDLPSWNYLYSKDDLRIGVAREPYTLYRVNFGISLNNNHEKNVEFDDEVKRIRNDICVDTDNEIKKRIFRYENKLIRFIAGKEEIKRYIQSNNPKETVLSYISSLE